MTKSKAKGCTILENRCFTLYPKEFNPAEESTTMQRTLKVNPTTAALLEEASIG